MKKNKQECMDFSKRHLIKLLGIGGVGVLGVGSPFSAEKSLAASWTVNNTSAETLDGKISNFQIKQANFDLDSFEWNNLDDSESDHVFTVRFLASTESMGSYEEIGMGEFSHSDDSGSINSISFDVNPFPVDFFSAPSISASDFESNVDGSTESTTVDLKIVFETDSVSDSATQSFDVDVTNLTSVTIDSFEDQDYSEYIDSTNWSFDTTDSKNGSVSAVWTANNLIDTLYSSSGLPVYPEAGDTFQYWFKSGSASVNGHNNAIYFGVQTADNSNEYQLINRVKGDQNEFVLRRKDGGSNFLIDSSSQTYNTKTWYRVVIDWGESGTITATLYDESGAQLNQISGVDTTYSSGMIGFAGISAGTTGSDDYVKVDDVKLI